MRRFWSVVVALAMIFGLALAVPAAASAAGLHALAGGCTGQAYPPSPHATIAASTTTPSVGETIEASGTAYCANEDVRITLAGTVVGTTHTDGTGSFDPPVKVTKTGKLQLCGIGASGLANDRDCLTLTVKSLDTGGTHKHKGSGGTSVTGADIALLCLLAAVLLGGGWAFVAAGRRKRLVDTHS